MPLTFRNAQLLGKAGLNTATDTDTLYNLIKSYEDQFPIPAPYVTVNVGTLNAASGTFTGLTTHVTTDPEPVEHTANQHPVNPPPKFVGETYVSININAQWKRTSTIEPAPKVALAPVKLQFNVTGTTAPWSVTVNGVTATASAGQQSVSVDIWDSQSATWNIQAGAQSHHDSLRIQRPVGLLGVGVGAFTIPVLPISIIYAPPKDSAGRSTATYSEGDTYGTSFETTFGTDTSSTSATMQTSYAAPSFIGNMLSQLGTALGLAGTGAAGAAKAVSTIASEFGKVTSTETTDNSETTDDKLTFTETTSNGFGTTAAAGGPGSGDVIVFARGIQMMWVSFGDELRLVPIGFDTVEVSVSALRNNPAQSQIKPADLDFLLSFDPLAAGGPDADLPANRFQFQQHIEYGGGAVFTGSLSVTRGSSTTVTDKTVTTDTSQWDAGPLFQLIGLGGKTSTSITSSSASGTNVSNTIGASFNLQSGPTDYFVINIYYDTVFGTFAFQQETPTTTSRFAGSGTGAGQPVTLTAGGKTFHAVTNQNGAFEFRSRTIPAGAATLRIGTEPPKQVVIAAMTAGAGG